MHPSQYQHMKRAMNQYLPRDRHIDVLELGSGTSPGQTQTHRDLLGGLDHSYLGVDVRPGNNIDVVMTKPYTIPAPSRSKDVVIAGSVLEHVPFFWASMLEVAEYFDQAAFGSSRCRRADTSTAPLTAGASTRTGCVQWLWRTAGPPRVAHPLPADDRDGPARLPENRRPESLLGQHGGGLSKPENYPLEMQIIRPVVRWGQTAHR